MGFAVMSLSDAAAGRVKAIVENAGGDARGIRVSVKKGGCAGMEYAVDLVTEPNAKDDLIERDGLGHGGFQQANRRIFQDAGRITGGVAENFPATGISGGCIDASGPQGCAVGQADMQVAPVHKDRDAVTDIV